MRPRTAPPAGSWSPAAEQLAGRVNRRTRHGALVQRAGAGLVAAALAALALRVLGARVPGLDGPALAALGLALGLLGGLLAGVRAMRRAPRVGAGDAAWALDRLAQAGGRGLAASLVDGPAASEAAFAPAPLGAPPTVRLLPPRGLAWLAGGLLLGTLACLAPAPAARDAEGTTAAAGGGAAAGGLGAPEGSAVAGSPGARTREAEAAARTLVARAEGAGRVRAALALPSAGALDPRAVAEALARPQLRDEALRAVPADSGLAALLRGEGEGSDGAALARALAEAAAERAEAERRRREAAGLRAGMATPAVPAARRAVVARYLERIE